MTSAKRETYGYVAAGFQCALTVTGLVDGPSTLPVRAVRPVS